jgi:hypothetical protein
LESSTRAAMNGHVDSLRGTSEAPVWWWVNLSTSGLVGNLLCDKTRTTIIYLHLSPILPPTDYFARGH